MNKRYLSKEYLTELFVLYTLFFKTNRLIKIRVIQRVFWGGGGGKTKSFSSEFFPEILVLYYLVYSKNYLSLT